MSNRALIIDVLTLFPEMFAPFIGLSIVGRAVESGLIDVRLHHLLDSLNGRERIDDSGYGGGLVPTVELAANYGLNAPLVNEASKLIEEHLDEIRSAWAKHFPG